MADKKPEDKTHSKTEKKTAADQPAKKTAAKTASKGAEAAPKSPKASKPAGTAPKRRPFHVPTTFAKVGEPKMHWKLIDASNIPLGRLSSHVATLLMGKNKPSYTPHTDTGDHVVVVNCERVVLTGKKWDSKVYNKHTGYPGGIKEVSAKTLLDKQPDRLIKLAVWRMLPKSRGHMTRHWFKKLNVYAGPEHPHKAQKPEAVKLPNLGTWE